MAKKLAELLIISDEKKAERGLIALIILPLLYIVFVILRDFRGMPADWVFNIGVNLMASLVCSATYRSCMRDSASIGEHKKDFFLTLLFICGTSVFLAGTAWILNGIKPLIFLNRVCNVLLFLSDFILVLIFWACEQYILNVDKKICKYVNTYLEIMLIPSLLLILMNLYIYNGEYMGKVYDGEWKNDMREGKGIEIWPDGDRFEGHFLNDLRDGRGIYYYYDGERHEGYYKNGKKEGIGLFYYTNGDLKVCNYFNDKQIGKIILLTANGEVQVANVS